MKLLIAINSLATGGAEKLLLDSIPEYIRRGVEVDLLLLDGTDSAFLGELKLRAPHCRVISLGRGSCYRPWLVLQLVPILHRYDIVNVHLFPALYWVALAKLLSRSATKLVYTEHSTSNKRRNGRLLGAIDRFIYRRYDRVICISASVKDALRQHLRSGGEKLVTIPNGVDLGQLHRAQPYAAAELPLLAAGKRLLLQVSSFIYPKDQATLIRALPLLAESVELVLVGVGAMQDECRQLAMQLGVAHRVHFLGVRLDVPRLLKSVDVVILSSRHEGLSLSSIEGLASGKPFVASDVPGLADIVAGAGVLFPQGDERALAQAITALLDDDVHRAAVVAACVERSRPYGIDAMLEQHLALYATAADW